MTTPLLSTIAFATSECNQVHALCDKANVPRSHDGGPFTMSQRVEILATVYARVVSQLVGADKAVQH